MNKRILRSLALVGSFSAVAGTVCAQDVIKNYLFNHSAGPVAANDIIGVAGSVVSGLQTPKDLVMALSAAGNRDTQAGFAIAVTPGRTALPWLSISADKYANGDVLSRVWGGTTFSYAQNKRTLAGTDYAQSSSALNITYQLTNTDDPIVVAYNAFRDTEGGICQEANAALEIANQAVEVFKRRRVTEEETRLQRQLKLDELSKVNTEATSQHAEALKRLVALRDCAFKAASEVAKKWNASRLQLVVGQGWIQSPAVDAPRLSLGKHTTLSLALPAGGDGLVNLTLRRVASELVLDTIAKTPNYKSTNSGGARYTYRMGKDNDLYAIAEASTIQASTLTSSSADFKYALGVDRKLADGLWLEFRYGRSRKAEGTGLENKMLFSLKFSPDTTLDKQIK